MDPISIASNIDLITNPTTRIAAISLIIGCFSFGFAAGYWISERRWEVIRLRMDREDKEKEKNRWFNERARLRMAYGVCWGVGDHPYCPVCFEGISRFAASETGVPFTKCLKCGHSFCPENATIEQIEAEFPINKP